MNESIKTQTISQYDTIPSYPPTHRLLTEFRVLSINAAHAHPLELPF